MGRGEESTVGSLTDVPGEGGFEPRTWYAVARWVTTGPHG